METTLTIQVPPDPWRTCLCVWVNRRCPVILLVLGPLVVMTGMLIALASHTLTTPSVTEILHDLEHQATDGC